MIEKQQKAPSIEAEIKKRSFVVSLKISLVLFVVFSGLFFWFQFRQTENSIQTKLGIDSPFIVNALKIGDLFFITRYLSAFVDSGSVTGIGIQELEKGAWLNVSPNQEVLAGLGGRGFSVGFLSTKLKGTWPLMNNGTATWQLYYVYNIHHGFLLMALVLSFLMSLLIFTLLQRLLTTTSDFFTAPISNLSRDLDAQRERATKGLKAKHYEQGHRFEETDQFVDELKRLISEINIQQGKMKEFEILKALNRLSRQVNHDVQSPLGALKTALERMQDEPDKATRLIQKSVGRIESIVSDLKAKNPDEMNTSAMVQRTELNRFIGNVVEEKMVEYRSQGVLIDFVGYKEQLHHDIDQTQMYRALSNIINNGIEAVEDKTPQIKVRLLSESDRVIIEIEDNGKGIPPHLKELIFQEGFTSNKPQGSGIGLTQALESVNAHGGDLSVLSPVSHFGGSVVRVSFLNQSSQVADDRSS